MPPTATKPKPSTAAPTDAPSTKRTAEQFGAEAIEKMRIEADMLLSRAQGNPVPGDMSFFTSLGRTDREIKDGLWRAERKLGWMKQAGTAAHRSELRATLSKFEERVRTDVTRLHAEAEAKLAEARRINGERDLAHRAVELSDQAVDLLTKYENLEPFTQRELTAIRRENFAHPAVQETSKLRSRFKVLGELVRLNVTDHKPQIRDYFRGTRPDASALWTEFGGSEAELAATWDADRTKLVQEQSECSTRLAEVEPNAEQCWAREKSKIRFYLDLIEERAAAVSPS